VSSAVRPDTDRFLSDLERRAVASGVFGSIERRGEELRCQAKDAAAEAWYVVAAAANGWTVRLVTADRWLSESIETDLMHYGDPIEELIEEELAELGHDLKAVPMPPVKHFRDEAKLYTFESTLSGLPAERMADAVAVLLHAYEAAFRQLGDMEGGDEDE
jgi:hypothetical protein